ncbi:MAG: hypothetical protein IKD31_06195 [Clostridia bacterium]|nr:hypothetical protein [Clostridia bacterium]
MKKMFLDLGDGISIPMKKVVLILNAESATLQHSTRNFLKKMSADGNTVMPKRDIRQVNSLILANAYGKDSLYSSSRSARALAEKEL